MKKVTLFLVLSVCTLLNAQISVVSSDYDGSILITPKGLIGGGRPYKYTNVALGKATLFFNTTGDYNTAIGNNSLNWNTSGYQNTAVGASSLHLNSSGFGNTAIGRSSLFTNSTGLFNTATGLYSLNVNNSGSYNCSFGSYGLRYNSTGKYNTALGYVALYTNTTGDYNTGAGGYSLYTNTFGKYNTAIGYFSLHANLTGDENSAIGVEALKGNVSGTGNTAIGYHSDVASSNLNNATAIGAHALVDDNNKIRIGNNSVTVIEGQVPWSTPSDLRLKENIVDNVDLGLNFILKLNPKRYNYISDKTKRTHDGFIAQEVEEIVKGLNLSFGGIQISQNGTYSLSYSDFVMPLVNAAKEQHAIIMDLKKKNESYESSIKNLRSKLEYIEKRFNEEIN